MQIELLNHQWEFLESQSKFTLLSGGIGSGKSWVGSHYLVNRVSQYPSSLHFVGANTYSQLRDSTLACLFGVLSDLGISFSYNQNHGILEFLGAKVLCKSMDNYNTIRGIEIASFWLDEVRDTKKDAFDMLMGRLRCKKCDNLQGRLTSSPSGFNWLFDYFHPNGEFTTNEFKMINAKSYDNPHLPDGYIDSLQSQYTTAFFEQEVLGEFVNITQGKVYTEFDREKHVQEVTSKGVVFYLGQDFNVDPMAGVICEYYNGKFHILDEVFLRNSDTFKLCKDLKYRFRDNYINIIPDSTASNRKTSGRSDIEILKSEGFEVMHTRNPYVMDRVNNINRLLSKGKIIIDPKCKKLINDLEKVSWVEGKIELDQKSDKLLTHVSDALGYLCWKLDPIQLVPRGVTISRY